MARESPLVCIPTSSGWSSKLDVKMKAGEGSVAVTAVDCGWPLGEGSRPSWKVMCKGVVQTFEKERGRVYRPPRPPCIPTFELGFSDGVVAAIDSGDDLAELHP